MMIRKIMIRKMSKKFNIFSMLMLLVGSLLISTVFLAEDSVEAAYFGDPPPLCQMNVVVLTCVPLITNQACGTIMLRTVDATTSPPTTAYSCYKDGMLVTTETFSIGTCADFFPAVNGVSKMEQKEFTDGITQPTRYCEAKPETPLNSCALSDSAGYYQIELSTSEISDTCYRDLVGTSVCPLGNIQITTVHSTNVGTVNPLTCRSFINRPQKCPAPSGDNTIREEDFVSSCIEIQIKTASQSCGVGFTRISDTRCTKSVSRISGDCPGSRLTTALLTSAKAKKEAASSGEQQTHRQEIARLDDLDSSETARLAALDDEDETNDTEPPYLQDDWGFFTELNIHRQSTHSLLVSRIGVWPVLNADGTTTPDVGVGLCVKFERLNTVFNCPAETTRYLIGDLSSLSNISGAEVRVCLERNARPTSPCPEGQTLVSIDSDADPETCMLIVSRNTSCARPTENTQNIVVVDIINDVVECREEAPFVDPCPTGFQEETFDTDPLMRCTRIVSKTEKPYSCPTQNPIFVVATTTGSETTYMVNDVNFRILNSGVIQNDFPDSVVFANQKCGSLQSFIPCLTELEDYPISLGKDFCGGSSLTSSKLPTGDDEDTCPTGAVLVKIDIATPNKLCVTRATSTTVVVPAPPTSSLGCPVEKTFIAVGVSGAVTTPVVGTLNPKSGADALSDNTNYCFTSYQATLGCSTPQYSITALNNKCLPSGVRVGNSVTNCLPTQTFDISTQRCVAKDEVTVLKVVQPCPSTHPVEIDNVVDGVTQKLCGQASATKCVENLLQVRLVPTDTEFTCYIPSRYLCVGIQGQPEYLMLRRTASVELDGVEVEIKEDADIYCRYGTNLVCPDNYELVPLIQTNVRSLTGLCQEETPSSPPVPMDATIGTCGTSLSIRYSITPLSEGDPVVLHCVELASQTSSPYCATGQVLVDLNTRSDFLSTDTGNGIGDTCFTQTLPPSCMITPEDVSGCVGTARYTTTSCIDDTGTSRGTIIPLRYYYNEARQPICGNYDDRELPDGCSDDTYVYLTPTQISTTEFLTDSNVSQVIRDATKDGICGRASGAANQCSVATARYYFRVSATSSFVARCYLTIDRTTACPMNSEPIAGDDLRCTVLNVNSMITLLTDSCPSIDRARFSLNNKYVTRRELAGRFLVSQAIEVRFKKPSTITCTRTDTGSQPGVVTLTFTLRLALVNVIELEPFDITVTNGAGPTTEWTITEGLTKQELGFWQCVNDNPDPRYECTTRFPKAKARETYIRLYETAQKNWKNPIANSFLCDLTTTNINDDCYEAETGSDFSIDFIPLRATWYKVSLLFVWRVNETRGSTDTTVDVIDVAEEIISVGETRVASRVS